MRNPFLNLTIFKTLRNRFIVIFSIISVAPLILVTLFAFLQFQESLRRQASDGLVAVRNLKAKQVEAYIQKISEDIRLVARLPNVIKAIQQLEIAARGIGLEQVRASGFLGHPEMLFLPSYNPYAIHHANHHAFFTELVQTKKYADVWLVALNGDIIYSYAKRTDFATNVFRNNVRHAPVIQLITALYTQGVNGGALFADFTPYAPANNRYMSFVGIPIVEHSEIVGLLVYMLSMDKIVALMEDYTGLGKTGDTYLVGADKRLRSNPRFLDAAQHWDTPLATAAVWKGLLGETGVQIETNYLGRSVLSAYQPIDTNGIKWVIVAEVQTAEAFRWPRTFRNRMIAVICGMTVLVVVGGLFIGRKIAGPIVALEETATHIAAGNLDLRVKINSNDEIGHLARAFNFMTAKLKNALHKSEAANQAKSEFLKNISHELRTPLNGIISATSLIENQDDLREMIQTSSDTLLKTIEQILDFSGYKDGEININAVPFKLSEALSHLKRRFFHKGNYIIAHLQLMVVDETVPNRLIGDAHRLIQVLNLLLENAAKFSPGGAELMLTITTLEQTDVSYTLQFALKDHGIGIPRKYYDTIFEPFSQVDESSTRAYDGAGIGLSLCREIVTRMGGTIWVDSVVGQGSSFYFTAQFGRQRSQEYFKTSMLSDQDIFQQPADPVTFESFKTLDHDQIIVILKALKSALIASDPGAIKHNHEKLMAGRLPGLNELTARIKGYEYEEAIQVLNKIITEYL